MVRSSWSKCGLPALATKLYFAGGPTPCLPPFALSAVLAPFSGEFAGAKLLTPWCRAYRKNDRKRELHCMVGCHETHATVPAEPRSCDSSVGSELKAGEEACFPIIEP
jgi:hypothetical protein